MADQQSMVPQGMGYIGSQNNDALIAAMASINNKGYATPADGGLGGGILGLLIASQLFRHGDKDKVIETEILKSIGDTKAEAIKAAYEAKVEACKSESAIQSAIQVQDANNQINFRAQDQKICDVQKDAITVGKDAIINSLQIEARTTDRLTAFERNTAENFCEVKTNLEKVHTSLALQIEQGFCKSREEILRAEIDELKRGRDLSNQNLAFSNQLTALNSIIMDLKQEQRMTNQTIQFGQGNLAGTSSTNNQVR